MKVSEEVTNQICTAIPGITPKMLDSIFTTAGQDSQLLFVQGEEGQQIVDGKSKYPDYLQIEIGSAQEGYGPGSTAFECLFCCYRQRRCAAVSGYIGNCRSGDHQRVIGNIPVGGLTMTQVTEMPITLGRYALDCLKDYDEAKDALAALVNALDTPARRCCRQRMIV